MEKFAQYDNFDSLRDILSRRSRDSRSCSTGFKFLRKGEIAKIPKTTGVYAFLNKKEFLYIGKASNLRERIKNHFQQRSFRDGLFLDQVSKIGYIETDSEIEALILEAGLIKKYQPKYNIIWRDDKNYFFIGITKENYPKIFITHQIQNYKSKFKITYIGPFVDGKSLKATMKVLRKVFPHYTTKTHPKGPCPWCHLKLCPGPNPNRVAYQKDVKNLIAVLKGKKNSVLRNLRKEMERTSSFQDYEKASKIRDQIEALEKVISHAKIFDWLEERNALSLRSLNYGVWENMERVLKEILKNGKKISRIEAYDVSNIQGNLATGSMITFIQGKPDKNFYRRFKITGKFTPYRTEGSGAGPNDVAMLKEVLERRLKHSEWPYPDLILIDGGKAQLNVARQCLTWNVKQAKVMALAKKENKLYIENKKKPLLLKSFPREIFNLILQLRDEAHRFAISYHKKLRAKALLEK